MGRVGGIGRILVCTVVLTGGCAAATYAQSTGATTGDIDGRVVDANGAAIAGVSVVAKSPALVGPLVVESAADGAFRLPLLPPGRYSLSFARAGFQAIERDVSVDLGATSTVDVHLDVAIITVDVTVSGTGIDRRSSTLAFVLNAAELQRLPGPRSMWSILSLTPSVSMTRMDGGGAAFTTGGFSAYGTTGLNRPMLEGINVSNLNIFGFAPDHGTLESVSVGTGAYGPEYASPGVHMQFVTRSGSNRVGGAWHASYQDGGWQAHNIDADQIARGASGAGMVSPRDANRLLRFHDVNADAGGPFKRDVAWWYFSARDQSSSAWQVAFPIRPLETAVTTLTGKTTWRASAGHRLTAFIQRGRNHQPIRLDAFLRTAATARNQSIDSTSSNRADALVWKGEWTAALGASVFVEARAGQFTASRGERPNGSGPRVEDLLRPDVSGRNREWREDWRNNQANGALTYARGGWLGRHLFKAGVQIHRTSGVETWTRAYLDDVLQVTQNGVAREVYLFQTPSRAEVGQWWYALYLSDSWQAGERLTLNLGLRFDRLRAFLPPQNHPAGRFNQDARVFPAVDNLLSWNVLAPRMGASYDLGGDGRTFVKASYALYRLPLGQDLGWNLNPNTRVWWQRFKWSDLDGDRTWQPGEEFDLQEIRGGEVVEAVDGRLRLPHVHELAARFQREAAPGVIVESGVVWRGERQHFARRRALWPASAFDQPRTVDDPGPDGVPGTGDDGRPIAVVELRPDLLGQSAVLLTNPPYTTSDHVTWEAVVRRRLTSRWSVVASVAHTWNRDQAREYVGQPIRANEFPLTPNDFINTDAGGRHVFRDWTVKALGTWLAPFGVALSSSLRHQSGQAFGRTLKASLNYGNIQVLAEPVGTRRQDHITLVELRADKDLRLGHGRRASLFAEVFNLLNANPAQNVSWETGASFLSPLSIVAPRILRLGFRVDW